MCEFSRSWLLVAILAEILTIAVVISMLLQWQGDYSTATRGGHTNSTLRVGECSGAQYVDGAMWREKTFCQDFLVRTFHEEIPMCGGTETADRYQVKCYGSVYAKMATCVYESLSVRPQLARNIATSDTKWNQPENMSINLLSDPSIACEFPSTEGLQARTNAGDFETKLAQYLLESEKAPPSVCVVWVNKTTFLHISNAFHIYFRFLDLYNVHKAIIDYSDVDEGYQVVRIGNLMSGYLFPEFDKALFPGALTLDDLQKNGTVCFKKAVLVPASYQSSPFRCKMNRMLRSQCFECNGRGLTDSPFYSFRRRVLQACNITETDYCSRKHITRLTVVSRKPYKRWPTDDQKKFQRVLRNEDDMIAQIRQAFPNATVRVVHLEDLNMCEQVRSAVEADVMMGVHGAGLVHFWWLREDATGLELEPSFESGNPSFRMLTTLAGRNYVSEMVGGISSSVSVNIRQLIEKLRQIIS